MIVSFSSKFFDLCDKVAKMVVVSFWWVVTCLPVLTVVPSTIALYYTAAKVIRRDVGRVTPEFFGAFKTNLRQGIALDLIWLVIAFLLFGIREFYTWQGISGDSLGGVYYVFSLVITVVWVCVSFYMLPVLSRFRVTLFDAFRLSLHFGAKNLITMIPLVITLAGMCAVVYMLPVLVFLVPGFYAYLMTKPVEKVFRKYILNELPDPEAHAGLWYMDED